MALCSFVFGNLRDKGLCLSRPDSGQHLRAGPREAVRPESCPGTQESPASSPTPCPRCAPWESQAGSRMCCVQPSMAGAEGWGFRSPQGGSWGLANQQSEASEKARKAPPTTDTGHQSRPAPPLQWSQGAPTQRARIRLSWRFRLRSLRHLRSSSEVCRVRSKEREINSRLCLA